MKKCNKCNEEKDLSNFCKDRTKKDGLATICIECKKISGKLWREQHKEELSLANKEWRKNNKEYIVEYRKKIIESGINAEYQKREREKNKLKNAERKELNSMDFLSSNSKKCRKCKEVKTFLEFWKAMGSNDGFANICKKCDTERRIGNINNNREHHNKVRGNYHKAEMITNENYRIRTQMSQRLNKALIANSEKSSIVNDLGCSIKSFKQHLESLFTEGMNWDNYGAGKNKWCLDHKIPLALFNLENKSCYKKACHYTNIQPMWYNENSSKKHSLVYDNN